jgi:uncharacterized membrane protein
MKRFLLIALAFIGVVSLTMAVSGTPAVFADAKSEICAGVGAAAGGGGDCTASGGTSVNNIIAAIVNILSLIVGVVAVIMIIVGGFTYVTSGGDSSKIGTAKNTIIYAVVGLVVVFFAQAIVQFVLKKL